jgi:hypothetical protein
MGDRWLSLVALAGWLVLSLAALRAHRIGARRMVTLALTWAAIFVLVAALFTAIGRS